MTMTPSNPVSLEQLKKAISKKLKREHTAGSHDLRAWYEAIDAELKRRESEAVPVVERIAVGTGIDWWWNTDVSRALPKGTKLYLRAEPPSQPSTGVPDGWQLVPIEPTQWMKVQGGEGIESNSFLDLWRRVLAAAPRSP